MRLQKKFDDADTWSLIPVHLVPCLEVAVRILVLRQSCHGMTQFKIPAEMFRTRIHWFSLWVSYLDVLCFHGCQTFFLSSSLTLRHNKLECFSLSRFSGQFNRETLKGKYQCTVDFLFDLLRLVWFANKQKLSIAIQDIPNQLNRCQFHQHFMSSFCAEILSPKN